MKQRGDIGWERLRRGFLTSCGLFLFWVPALAQNSKAESPTPEFLVVADRQEIKIGDVVHLRLRLSVPEGWQLQPPTWPPQLGEWKFRAATSLPATRTRAAWKQTEFDLEVAVYKVGEIEIPPLEAVFITPAGEKNSLKSNPLKIRVASVLPAGKPEIKDLKPQLELPRDYLWLSLLLGALVLLGLGGYLVYRFYRRRKLPILKSPPPEIPPDQAALTAIARLLERGLIEAGKFKEFYLELSEIVKKYLGIRLQVIALERTTEEFLQDLETVTLPHQARPLIRGFLEDCDRVKFAKYLPEEAEAADTVKCARQIIEETEKYLVPPVLAGEFERA